ncbi:MAG: sulfotransferase family protein [Myxococcota bacterium]
MSGLPDFVVIGAMKCGTSSLHEQLALRSGVHMSTPKEPNFFSDDANHALGLDHYRRCFDGAREEQIVGESSTHYTKLPTHPRSVERLAEVLPDARFVYVVRHPIDRIVSQYVHEWSQREVSGSLEEAVTRHERFVAYSQYARQLEPWIARFGRERILLVGFERMLAEPDAELARVCAFLSDPTPDAPRWQDLPASNVSSERLRRSALRESLLALRPLRALADRLPAGLRETLKRPWRMDRRPELSPAARAALVERLDPDLARLGGWLGRPLSVAGWNEAVARAPLDWAPRHDPVSVPEA